MHFTSSSHQMLLGQNLASLLWDAAARFPDKPALYVQNGHSATISYAEFLKEVQSVAAFCLDQDLKPGNRVGLLLYNTPHFVTCYFALLALGMVVIPLNTRLTAQELNVILTDAQASQVISSEDFADILPELNTPYWLAESMPHLSAKIEPVTIPKKNMAVLIYTSGTTGKPKGVMLSHENLWADAAGNAAVIEAIPDDIFVTVSPLFHVFGQVNILLTAILAGSAVVLVKKFSPKSVLEAVQSRRVTFLAAVPTMYQMMLAVLRENTYDLSSLRVCHSGAAPMAAELFTRIEAVFGAPVQEGYGLSEASSIVTSNPLHGVRKPKSVGKAIPGVTVEARREDGSVCEPDEIGELYVSGKTVMLGYYQNPEATAKVLKDNWLKTGDLAYLDADGYVHIVDRQDDLMNIGGQKVYPREIEEILYQHPGVDAVAVVGIPSELYHHVIQAFIVTNQPLTDKDLQAFCREHLAPFKIPQTITFVDEIPKGATGKILRHVLRQQI